MTPMSLLAGAVGEPQPATNAGPAKAASNPAGRPFQSLIAGSGSRPAARALAGMADPRTGSLPMAGPTTASSSLAGLPPAAANAGPLAPGAAIPGADASALVQTPGEGADLELEQGTETAGPLEGQNAATAGPPAVIAGTAGLAAAAASSPGGHEQAGAEPGLPTLGLGIQGGTEGGADDAGQSPAGSRAAGSGLNQAGNGLVGPAVGTAPAGMAAGAGRAGQAAEAAMADFGGQPFLPTASASGADAVLPASSAPAQPQTASPAAGNVSAHHGRAVHAEAPGAQLFVRIEQAAAEGQTRFAVRLDPEELGRVEVVLDFQDGRVQAMIAADRPATLELLQRDARWLERALEQGGFKLQQDGLQFTLRDGQAGAGQEGGQRAARLLAAGLEGPDARDDMLAPVAARRLEGLVDIQV